MSVLVKAVYKQGMFQPVEPIGNLAENQSVQLQIWPDIPQEEVPEEDAWVDTEFEEEWAKLSPWEQQGLHPPTLTEEQIEERVKWVSENSLLTTNTDTCANLYRFKSKPFDKRSLFVVGEQQRIGIRGQRFAPAIAS